MQTIIDQITRDIAPELGKGHVADYIPALARVSPNRFGIAVATIHGDTYSAGDAREPFSIQSISKVFGLTLALEQLGDELWKRVNREPSGSPFNSIVQLEWEKGVPRNPLINAGALVVTDVNISHGGTRSVADRVVTLLCDLSGNSDVTIDSEVAESEGRWGHRNASLANFIKSFGNLENDVSAVLEAYYDQCSISMSALDLCRAGLFLANSGQDPATKREIVTAEQARRLNAIMLTCGHYDASGDFAFRVGLPGKSGVGGGIMAIVPGSCVVTVWSPALNAYGNSHAGTIALERFAALTGASVF